LQSFSGFFVMRFSLRRRKRTERFCQWIRFSKIWYLYRPRQIYRLDARIPIRTCSSRHQTVSAKILASSWLQSRV